MRFFAENIAKYLVYGNIWVSLGAVCLYWTTVHLHGLEYSLLLSMSIFGATLFIYNYHRLFRQKVIYFAERSERHRWILERSKPLGALAVAGAILAVAGNMPFMSPALLLRSIPFILLALLYVIPLWKTRRRWIRLRDVPYLKIFMVAATWSFVTVVYPFLATDPLWLPGPQEALTILHRFLFIFAITLPFDIRDREHDRQSGVVTFVSLVGTGRVKTAGRFLLLITALVALGGNLTGWYSTGHTLGLVISAGGSGWLISGITEDSGEWYYSFLLDGTMPDQLFWVWLMGWLL